LAGIEATGLPLGTELTLGIPLGARVCFKLGIVLTLGIKLTLGIALGARVGFKLGIALTLGTKLTLGIALGAPHVLGVELLLVLEEPLLEVEVEGLLLLLEVEVVEEGLLVPLLPPLSLLLPLSHLS